MEAQPRTSARARLLGTAGHRRGPLAFLTVFGLILPTSLVAADGPFDQQAEIRDLRKRCTEARSDFTRFCGRGWGELDQRLSRIEEMARTPVRTIRNGKPYSAIPAVDREILARFRTDLETQVSGCEREALARTERVLRDLREGLAATARYTAATATAAEAQSRAVRNAEEFVGTATARLEGERSYGDVISEGAALFEDLERSVRGESCDRELAAGWSRFEEGAFQPGTEGLAKMMSRPCLTNKGNEDVRAKLEAIADIILSEDASTTGIRLPRERAERLAPLLAAVLPARQERLLAAARSQAAATGPDPAQRPQARTGTLAHISTPLPAPTASARRERGLTAQGQRETWLALDVWQSAWGNFTDADLEKLFAYLKRNHISEIYLNPGIAPPRTADDPGAARLERLVQKFRENGISRINFLYAELNYPVGEYARLLRKSPQLGITLLADDSEFRDSSRGYFERNMEAARAEGVAYTAYVTVEGLGNSGVSNETRQWAIKELDEVILMSYFSCGLEGQKKWLAPLLADADATGRKGFLRIAILMGTKKMGKEVSCEKVLGPKEMQAFLRDLHGWALQFPSYGGIVLETNERFPSYSVAPERW